MQNSTSEQQNIASLAGLSDQELLRRYSVRRSEEAFTELSRRYFRLIFATCLRETRDRTLAEDAAQGVLLLLSQKAGNLQRVETLAGWLYTASRYVARNLLKQERRRRMHEEQALLEAAPLSDPGNPLWEQIEPHFHAALDRLKPADRAAVLLRYVQDESLANVGIRLGIPENTARMRISRAMEKVRTHLAKVGIAVSATLLAAVLEEQAADAVPIGLLKALPGGADSSVGAAPSAAVVAALRQTERVLFALSLRLPLQLLLGISLFFGAATAYRTMHPPILSPAERIRFFTALRGEWTGTLDYADDRTNQPFTLATTVTFDDTSRSNALRFVAVYPQSDREDITTVAGDPITGVFVADNGGPRSSHNLHSIGELVKLGPSEFAFHGSGIVPYGEVRLRFTFSTSQVVISEEYRRQGMLSYRFRNRFALRRKE